MTENSEVDKILRENKVKKPINTIIAFDKDGNPVKTLDEEELKVNTQAVLDFILDKNKEYKDFGVASKVLSQLIEVKKAYFPAAQTNKNLNVNLFDTQLDKWVQARQDLKSMTKEAPVVYEVTEKTDDK